MPEEGPIEKSIAKREEGRFAEVDDWGCACWRKKAEIELEIDFVQDKDDDWISIDDKLLEWVSFREDVV